MLYACLIPYAIPYFGLGLGRLGSVGKPKVWRTWGGGGGGGGILREALLKKKKQAIITLQGMAKHRFRFHCILLYENCHIPTNEIFCDKKTKGKSAIKQPSYVI